MNKNLKSKYQKINENIELDEFFLLCVKACEKEIMRSHELSQLESDDGISSSFFFELKRK